MEAEALDSDLLSDGSGAQDLKAWVKERFMDGSHAGRIISQFFRVLKRGHDQSV